MAATELQKRQIRGEVRIKCVKVGGITLADYGNYVFAENDELDLLDEAVTPVQILASTYSAAHTMVTDPACELTQRIAAGEVVVLVHKVGDPRVAQEITD